MSQMTKNQLGIENNTSFPNNNAGYITPTILRTFNQDMIDSLVDEDSYTIESGSFNARINALDPSGSAASILALNQFTASQYVSNSLFIQSSQTSSMSVASSSTSVSSSYALTASFALNASATVDTGSLVTTSSFNSYTASAASGVSASINAATSSLSASLTLTDNSKLSTGSFNTYTASAATNVSGAINTATSSLSQSLSASIGALSASLTLTDNSKLSTGSFNTYTSSNDSKVNALINKTGSYATTGSNTFVDNQIVSGNINVTGNITATSASFQYIQTVYETASIIFSSGSNQFGDELSDIQTLSGSVKVQGGLTVNGTDVLLVGQTASYASASISSSYALTASFALNAGASINTGSFATTGSNNFIGNQTISGSLNVSGAANFTGGDFKVTDQGRNGEFDVDAFKVKTQSSAQFTGSLLVSGGFNAKVAFPALNVTNNILQSTGSIIVAQDIVRQGGGASDVASLRLQARTGSAGAGDALVSTITAQNNLNTTTFLSASAVASLQATFSTGSGGGTVGYNAGLTATAQSGSAISVLSGNTIRLGTSAANVITSTGSFGAMVLVAPLNTPAFSLRSGSFEVTTPQGSGSFYTNLPITSSGMRLNGDARFSGIEVVGLVGANGSGSIAVEKNVVVSGSIIISGSGTLTLTGSYAGNLGFSGSVITNVGDTYTSTPTATNIITIDSASMATLLSGATTNANTLYFVI